MLLLDSALAGGQSLLQLNENGSVQQGASFWCLLTAASSGDSPLLSHRWQVTSLMSPQSLLAPNPCASSSLIPWCVYPAVSWTFCAEGYCEKQYWRLYWDPNPWSAGRVTFVKRIPGLISRTFLSWSQAGPMTALHLTGFSCLLE